MKGWFRLPGRKWHRLYRSDVRPKGEALGNTVPNYTTEADCWQAGQLSLQALAEPAGFEWSDDPAMSERCAYCEPSNAVVE